MHILENVNLAEHSTMRLGGKARYLADASTKEETADLVNWAKEKNLDCLVIGDGSNIVWRDDGYQGLIIVNKIKRRELVSEDENSATIKLGAGENWDEVVAWTVEKGLSGIEFLSLIPGTAGAGPVQNIGAYGAELSQVLVEVEAYDIESKTFITIPAGDCSFAYRTSRFKTTDKGRFIIINLVLKLKKSNPKPPFYEVLQNYLNQNRAQNYTPEIIRNAVIAIRSAKLPDPALVANNGSFFTNPIIDQTRFDELKNKYPDIKCWPASEGRVKVAAGWLVEQAGFLGYKDSETGMATSDKSALVLINEHAKSTADLLKFKQKIVDKVNAMFGITLEQEPELLP